MNHPSHNPRHFFERNVCPNYKDWLNDPLDDRLAMNAVTEANNMAAYIYQYLNLEGNLPLCVRNEGEYRNHISATICPDFAIIRDVADAHKHISLERNNRQVTSKSQTNNQRVGGYFNARYFAPSYFTPSFWGAGSKQRLVVTLDDRSIRTLSDLMTNVVNMWECQLKRLSL